MGMEKASPSSAAHLGRKVPAVRLLLDNCLGVFEVVEEDEHEVLEFAAARRGRSSPLNRGDTSASMYPCCAELIPASTTGAVSFAQEGV